MGRNEGGGRRGRDREKAPRVDVPGVPRLTIKSSVERQYGRQVVEALKRWDNALYEYDALIVSEELPFDDVALYVQEIGLFDELKADIPQAAALINTVSESRVSKILETSGSAEKADREGFRFVKNVMDDTVVTPHTRPLFHALFHELLFASRFAEHQKNITKGVSRDPGAPEAQVLQDLVATRNIPLTKDGALFLGGDIGDVLREFIFLAGCRDLSDALKGGKIPDEYTVNADAYRAEGDVIAASLRGLPTAPTKYTTQRGLEIFKNLSFTTPIKCPPAIMGIVELGTDKKIFLLNGGFFEIVMQLPLSRVTGDLALPHVALTSPEMIFRKYGIEKLFPFIRLQVLRSIEEAILLDKIPVEQDAFQTAFALRAVEKGVPAKTTEADITELPEAPVVLESVVAPVEVEEVPQPLEEANREEEFVVRERRAKAERLRTVHYRKAVSALGRLGVVLEPGGRHMKARYGEKTAAFPNSHSGKNADITYILRSVLEILGITEEDFIKAL